MSSFIYKEGLYEKISLENDIPTPRYKNYEYTKKDFIDTSYKNKIPFLFINNSNKKKIKLEYGVLTVNNIRYNIANTKVSEVIDILNKENINVQVLENSEIITTLPSILLSDFNNTTITKIDGDISPLNYRNKIVANKTIYSIEDDITNIEIINLNDNSNEPYSINGDNLFYVVGKNTKCYIKTISSGFYIFGDMYVKQVLDGSFIANLSTKLKGEQ